MANLHHVRISAPLPMLPPDAKCRCAKSSTTDRRGMTPFRTAGPEGCCGLMVSGSFSLSCVMTNVAPQARDPEGFANQRGAANLGEEARPGALQLIKKGFSRALRANDSTHTVVHFTEKGSGEPRRRRMLRSRASVPAAPFPIERNRNPGQARPAPWVHRSSTAMRPRFSSSSAEGGKLSSNTQHRSVHANGPRAPMA